MERLDGALKARPSFEGLRVFTFVQQTEVWLVWLIYSVVVALFLIAGTHAYHWSLMMGAWVSIGIPFLQYSLNIITATAEGRQRVPPMTGDGMRDPRLYKLLLLFSALASFVFFFDPEWRPWALAAVLLVWPAMVSIIAIEASLTSALNPVKLTSFILGMGLTYVALRMAMTGALLYVLLLIDNRTTLFGSVAGTLFLSVASVYLMLALSRCTGALLHARRTELGLLTAASPEQAEQQLKQQIDAERGAFLGHIYALVRADKFRQAWSELETRLKRERYADEDRYYDHLAGWEDKTLAHKLAQGYLKRLVVRSPEQAWRLYASILAAEQGNYRLDSGDAVLKFAAAATTPSRRRLMLDVLRHFEEDFPNHPMSRQAFLVGADLACELGETELAVEMMAEVIRRRGKVDKPTYDRCRRILSDFRLNPGG